MYFQATRSHFGLTTAEVVVADKTKGSAPISVVDYAQERAREPGGYDHIFCVFAGIINENPSTSVHKLVQHLKSVSTSAIQV